MASISKTESDYRITVEGSAACDHPANNDGWRISNCQSAISRGPATRSAERLRLSGPTPLSIFSFFHPAGLRPPDAHPGCQRTNVGFAVRHRQNCRKLVSCVALLLAISSGRDPVTCLRASLSRGDGLPAVRLQEAGRRAEALRPATCLRERFGPPRVAHHTWPSMYAARFRNRARSTLRGGDPAGTGSPPRPRKCAGVSC